MPLFVIIITVVVSIYSTHNSTVSAQELGSENLLARLFDQTEEVTVVESVVNTGAYDPGEFVSNSYLESALESPALGVVEPTGSSSGLAAVTTVVSDPQTGTLVRSGGSAPQLNRESVIKHTVQPGDTISTIAEEYGISTNTILWANNLSKYSIIKPGEDLTILPRTGILYTVKSGDNLSSIAAKYKIAINDIAEANDIVSENQLTINQDLIIPDAAPIPVVQRSAPTPQLANINTIFSSSAKTYTGSGSGEWVWPTPQCKRITQYYWLNHRALDIGCHSQQHDIVATKAGRVEHAGWSNGYGYNVVINHGGGVKSRYGHMSRMDVKVGEQVEQGQVLGKIGSTGNSTGPHVHFEIMFGSQKVNPLTYL